MSSYSEYRTAGVNRGSVRCHNGQIIYAGDVSWTVDVDDIILIGEYTNARGPHLEDYFVLIFLEHEVDPFFLPTGSFGFESTIEGLAEYLGEPLKLALFSSTHLASRVLWPQRLAGRRVFSLPKIARPGWRKLFDLFVPEFELRLTEEVRHVVQGGLPSPG